MIGSTVSKKAARGECWSAYRTSRDVWGKTASGEDCHWKHTSIRILLQLARWSSIRLHRLLSRVQLQACSRHTQAESRGQPSSSQATPPTIAGLGTFFAPVRSPHLTSTTPPPPLIPPTAIPVAGDRPDDHHVPPPTRPQHRIRHHGRPGAPRSVHRQRHARCSQQEADP